MPLISQRGKCRKLYRPAAEMLQAHIATGCDSGTPYGTDDL